jgi:hypothetical protein
MKAPNISDDDLATPLGVILKAKGPSLVSELVMLQDYAFSGKRLKLGGHIYNSFTLPNSLVSVDTNIYSKTITTLQSHNDSSRRELQKTHRSQDSYAENYAAVSYRWSSLSDEDLRAGKYSVSGKAGGTRRNKCSRQCLRRAMAFAPLVVRP